MYVRTRNPFDATVSGFPSSVTTSTPCWMGDFDQISISIRNNSTVTLLGSDNDLWKAAAGPSDLSSVISVIAAQGVYKIEPGFAWMTIIRSSSTNTVTYIGQARQ